MIRIPREGTNDLPCRKNIPGTARRRVGYKDRTGSYGRQFLLTCFLTIALLAAVVPVSAATITIDNTTAGGISLAVDNAGSGGTVVLNPGTYFIATSKEIMFPITLKANMSQGGTPSNTIIDGIRFQNKLFYVTTGGRPITLDNLTFQHFSNPGFHGGVIYAWQGPITITSSKFINCTAKYGGAFFTDKYNGVTGSSVTSSTFSGCSATDSGGAIYVMLDPLNVSSSTFAGGSAPTGSVIYSQNAGTTIHFSRFFNNSGSVVYLSNAGTLDATNNWWGTNTNPSGSVGGIGTVNTNPWLKLGITADSLFISRSQTSGIRANLTYNSDGTNISGSGYLPDGIPITFTSTRNTDIFRPAAGSMTYGANMTLFTPAVGGTAQANATVDNESLGVLITVLGADFTGTPTFGTTPLTVSFTDASGGSPTMWNWSFGDGAWFNTTNTAARSPTHTFTGIGTYTVNLTVTNAAVTDMLSRAGYIQVSAPPSPGSGGDDPPPSTNIFSTKHVNVGGYSAIRVVSVTGSGISGLIVTGTAESSLNTTIPQPPGIVYQYVTLVPARYDTITGATITFAVPAAWLTEHHMTPQDVVLYHYTGSTWEALPTTATATVNGFVTFTATTPSFSLFAISGVLRTERNVTVSSTVRCFGDLAAASTLTEQTRASVITKATIPPGVPADTTAVPAVANQPRAGGLPVTAIAFVAAGLLILAGGGFIVRRWWIRRQNPALFREYD